MARSPSHENPPLSADDQHSLFRVAANSILFGLDGGGPATPNLATLSESLSEPRGAFVTVRVREDLNGCIGVMEPEGPLAITVAKVAWEAAFEDPRLPALDRADLPDTEIVISVLSDLESISASTRGELLTGLRPGTDGLVLDVGPARATFLPAVWKQCPAPEEFVSRLLLKAGMPPNGWPAGTRAFRYTAFEFGAPFPAMRGDAE